jgi:hypothetical protein
MISNIYDLIDPYTTNVNEEEKALPVYSQNKTKEEMSPASRRGFDFCAKMGGLGGDCSPDIRPTMNRRASLRSPLKPTNRLRRLCRCSPDVYIIPVWGRRGGLINR